MNDATRHAGRWAVATALLGVAVAVAFALSAVPEDSTAPVPTDIRQAGYPPSPVAPSATATTPAVPDGVFVSPALQARDRFPSTVTLTADNRIDSLTYTGQFTRRRALLGPIGVNVYEIASYTDTPTRAPAEKVLDGMLAEGPRQVYLLRFVRGLTGGQIKGAFNEEVDKTFGDVDMKAQGAAVERFIDVFASGSSAGDTVYLVRLPGGRVFAKFRDPTGLQLIGQDRALSKAIWRIWTGEAAGPERHDLVKALATDR